MSDLELLRAAIFHTPANPFDDVRALHAYEDGALLIRGGRVVACGEYSSIAASAPDAPVTDWRGSFLLPGFVDTHVHFPQLRIIGSLGRSLLAWLDQVALPEEARMADAQYAASVARDFVGALAGHGTTTAMVFGAHFEGATAALFEEAAGRGLRLVSGMVLSDRLLCPDLHQLPEEAYAGCTRLIDRFHGRGRLRYAVTPRFALSASEAMLEMCQTLLREHDDLRVQTHLNENAEEVAAVARCFPWAGDYLAVYERFGLCGPRSVMAHSVHTTDAELGRLAGSRTSVSHCPCSNASLGSGLFPLRRHLAAGVHVALGTDVGAGTGFGLPKEGLHAYLTQRLLPDGVSLGAAHLLFLSTRAGAAALGFDDVGDFRPGKSADFVCVRPDAGGVLAGALTRADSLEAMLSAIFTLSDSHHVHEVRVGGSVVFRRGHGDD
jgi:guanine deaminase